MCHDMTHLQILFLQGRVEGSRKIGRPKMNCMDDVYEWTGMSTRSLFDVTKDWLYLEQIMHDVISCSRSLFMGLIN